MGIAKFGDLRYIDAFLTAPFVMFDDNSLSRLELINCSQRTRQIIGDSLFFSINILVELLNIFCSELRDLLSDSESNKQLERKLCHRCDHWIACVRKLEKFMACAVNKDFLPSFIPSKIQ